MLVKRLENSIQIDSPPEPIWEWLKGLTRHYTEWHPDHVSAEWTRGEPYEVGSILTAVEYLGGKREILRFEMTSVDPPYGFEYRIRDPISALLPGGAFEIHPADGGTHFTALILCRFPRLAERLFRRRMAGLVDHMREEGENLKHIIESAS